MKKKNGTNTTTRKESSSKDVNIDKAVFVGNTSELLKMIKDKAK